MASKYRPRLLDKQISIYVISITKALKIWTLTILNNWTGSKLIFSDIVNPP